MQLYPLSFQIQEKFSKHESVALEAAAAKRARMEEMNKKQKERVEKEKREEREEREKVEKTKNNRIQVRSNRVDYIGKLKCLLITCVFTGSD